jgi:hypothetical protein
MADRAIAKLMSLADPLASRKVDHLAPCSWSCLL